MHFSRSDNSCNIEQDPSVSVQDCVSSSSMASEVMFSISTTATRRFLHKKPSNACPLRLETSSSLLIRNFRMTLQTTSLQLDDLLHGRFMMQNGQYSPVGRKISNDQELIQSDPISCPGVVQEGLILSRPLLEIVADILLYMFREKKCQVSTIKGY